MIRVSCSAPSATISAGLIESLEGIGIKPITTPVLVRAVYEGPDSALGLAIVDIFSKEIDHDIYFDESTPKKKRRKH